MSLKDLRIALVCDWLTNSGGAEKVILALHQLFPQAPIYTSIYNAAKMPGFENATIHASYLQHFPFAKKKYQMYLGLMPHAFEQFDLSDYDIVISSSHSCAKGVITRPQTLHISYCHSPMRYAWENSHQYIREYQANSVIKKIAPFFLHKIRIWDRLSADRVDFFIANSKHIQNRIEKYYRKPSSVIYPFVDVKKMRSYGNQPRSADFFLAVGRLTPYKRFDLIIDAFNELGLPLKIVGTGVSLKVLSRRAKNNIEFLGYVSDEKLKELYAQARAFVFPQVEDFGITPLEAMSAGCPVIAYKKGGALETIAENKSGIFFEEQTVDSLKAAVQKLSKLKLKKEEIQKQAQKFDQKIFNQKILDFIEQKWQKWQTEMLT
jgi:glycosyltransferase involved in cell wall biosynthesis